MEPAHLPERYWSLRSGPKPWLETFGLTKSSSSNQTAQRLRPHGPVLKSTTGNQQFSNHMLKINRATPIRSANAGVKPRGPSAHIQNPWYLLEPLQALKG